MDKKPKAIELSSSDKALQFPNKSIDLEVLEDLLFEASELKIDKDEKVMVTYHRRVIGFDENSPEWEDVQIRLPLRELFEIYKKREGRDYVKPEETFIERLERKYGRRN
ncbi:hypothetical protein J4423_01035 [Candidatus Pacearchaeota archaeon]|nr:hypothetical protein [Candidatus Pacearchaeota archaeon]